VQRVLASDVSANPPVILPGTMQRDLTTRDGLVYRLLIGMPTEPAPPSGFPLLVLVDGNALFATAASTARLQAGRSEATGIGPAVVLGIGYPGDLPFDVERRQHDLLPVADGADRFLDVIAGDILPALAEIAPLDPRRHSLIGHSYGGLFALHALFTRPGLFGCHVASSPSIWWNDRAILGAEEAFRAGGASGTGRLLITVGEDEQAGAVGTPPSRAERLSQARMVDNAAEMAARLQASGRIACESVVFPGENHVSVIPAMLSRAVAFALAEPALSRTVAA
jgi:predicted alpha/beta superfamily hydrolase